MSNKKKIAASITPQYVVGQVDHVNPAYAYIVSQEEAQEDQEIGSCAPFLMCLRQGYR